VPSALRERGLSLVRDFGDGVWLIRRAQP
jgi:hypothetical protein